jgi:sec-independent protein translocase protein TatA
MDRLWYLIPLVLLIVLIFGGANKLPEIGAGMGRAIREFRHAMSGGPEPGARGSTPPAGGPMGGYDGTPQWAPVPETRPDETLRG